MKTLSFLSALAALVALLVVSTPAIAGSVLFAVSLVAIFAADYRRTIKPLALAAPVVPFRRPAPAALICEQAA